MVVAGDDNETQCAELARMVRAGPRRGLPGRVHAPGDATVAAFASAQGRWTSPLRRTTSL